MIRHFDYVMKLAQSVPNRGPLIPENSLEAFKRQIQRDKISSCLIYCQSQTIFEYYKNRKSCNKLFQVNSVTKSIISILVGIAIDNGILAGVESPISQYFADPYRISEESEKREITVEHLLTMTPGIAWGEFGEWGGLPFPMIYTKDWVKFFLEQKMESRPGESMAYNSGCSHLLSAILQNVTKGKTATYAERVLLGPLGISDYRWYEDSKGISQGGFGLCLKSADMLRIGIMMMRKGLWAERQVVSAQWVARATSAKYHTYDDIGSYGYHWWILRGDEGQPLETPVYFAMGYGGQYIIVVPTHEVVVVFTSELYKDTFRPMRHFREHLLSAISSAP